MLKVGMRHRDESRLLHKTTVEFRLRDLQFKVLMGYSADRGFRKSHMDTPTRMHTRTHAHMHACNSALEMSPYLSMHLVTLASRRKQSWLGGYSSQGCRRKVADGDASDLPAPTGTSIWVRRARAPWGSCLLVALPAMGK